MRFLPFFRVMSYCYYCCHIFSIYYCGFSSAFGFCNIWISKSVKLVHDRDAVKSCRLWGCRYRQHAQALLLQEKCLWFVLVSMNLICDSATLAFFYYQKATKTRFSLKMFLTVVQHQVNLRKNRVRDSENYGDLLACSWRFFNGFIGAPWCPNCSSISERNELVLASSRAFA